MTEKIVREEDGGGVEWCLVRPTTVWGPQMSPHYQNMLRFIRKGKYFHCGAGKLYKSYSYAGNIAFQYLKMLLAPTEMIHRQTFYLADYEPLSLRDYTNELARVMNAPSIPTMPLLIARAIALAGNGLNVIGFRRFPFNSFCLRNILTEYRFDMSKTRQVCGELPFSFDDGVKATAEWYLGLYPE
jgi:nucleoside-diphosphate-sugar epimerase